MVWPKYVFSLRYIIPIVKEIPNMLFGVPYAKPDF